MEEMSEVVMGLKATWELSTVRIWADLSQTILLQIEDLSIRRVTSVISGMFLRIRGSLKRRCGRKNGHDGVLLPEEVISP